MAHKPNTSNLSPFHGGPDELSNDNSEMKYINRSSATTTVTKISNIFHKHIHGERTQWQKMANNIYESLNRKHIKKLLLLKIRLYNPSKPLYYILSTASTREKYSVSQAGENINVNLDC